MAERWVTVNGSHVLIDGKGKAVKGNANVVKAVNSKAKSTAKTERRKVETGTTESGFTYWKNEGWAHRELKTQADVLERSIKGDAYIVFREERQGRNADKYKASVEKGQKEFIKTYGKREYNKRFKG